MRDVTVRYGQFTAVHDLSLDVRQGELVVLLGANGAGKSSFLRAVMGLERPSSGTIELNGEPLGKSPPHRRVARGLGYLPEGRGVFPNLTVEENILVGLRSMSRKKEALDSAYTLFPRMDERRKQIAGSLSGGEQQMLSLSRALAGDPKLLLLDELSLGLAPAIVVMLFAKIAELRDMRHLDPPRRAVRPRRAEDRRSRRRDGERPADAVRPGGGVRAHDARRARRRVLRLDGAGRRAMRSGYERQSGRQGGTR